MKTETSFKPRNVSTKKFLGDETPQVQSHLPSRALMSENVRVSVLKRRQFPTLWHPYSFSTSFLCCRCLCMAFGGCYQCP